MCEKHGLCVYFLPKMTDILFDGMCRYKDVGERIL